MLEARKRMAKRYLISRSKKADLSASWVSQEAAHYRISRKAPRLEPQLSGVGGRVKLRLKIVESA